MASEWLTVPLSDLYDFSSGLSKPRSEFGFGHGFLTFKDVLNNYFAPNQLSALVNSTEEEQANCSIKRGDVFLTRTSETQHELGMSCVALKDYPEATFNGFTKRLRPKSPDLVVPEYAAYYFRSPIFRQSITSMSSLSTRASLNNEMLSRLTILLPPVRNQKAMGIFLKTLDDKIDLNRQMNRTLEEMARVIFKSWFVDFDPVHAKAAGRQPPGLKPEIAALFPDSFDDSELGKIPKGWSLGVVQDLGEVICGKTPPTADKDNYGIDVPFVTIPDMHGKMIITETEKTLSSKGAETQKNKYLPPFSTCVSCIATPGLVALTSTQCQTNQQINSVVPSDSDTSLFCYFSLRGLGEKIRTHGAGGSVLLNLNKSQFSSLKILLPPKEAKIFQNVTMPILEKILNNEHECKILASIRDALLPKLISGELLVPDAERIAGRLL
jgi:type I restriction enzyme S subunit